MARFIKHISFNIETEKDILELAHSLPNFSKWVKDKLKEKIITDKVLKQNAEDIEPIQAEPLVPHLKAKVIATGYKVKNEEEIDANNFL